MQYSYIHNDKLKGVVKEDAQTLHQGRKNKSFHWVDYAFVAEIEELHLICLNIGHDHLSSVGYQPTDGIMIKLIDGYDRIKDVGSGYEGLLSDDYMESKVGKVLSGVQDAGYGDFGLQYDERIQIPELTFEHKSGMPVSADNLIELQSGLCGAKYAARYFYGEIIPPIHCRKEQTGYDPEIDVPDTTGWDYQYLQAEGQGDGAGYISELTSAQEINTLISDKDIIDGLLQKGIDINSLTLYFTVVVTERKDIWKPPASEEEIGEWETVIDYTKSVLCSVPVSIDKTRGLLTISIENYRQQLGYAMQQVGMTKQRLSGTNVSWTQRARSSGYNNQIRGVLVMRYNEDHRV